MAHVASAEILVDRLLLRQRRILLAQTFLKKLEELVQGRALAESDIVRLIQRLSICRRCCEKIGLHDVCDETEIAARLAVPIDSHRLAFEQRGNPFENDRRIRALGILARTEYIEIPQADGIE